MHKLFTLIFFFFLSLTCFTQVDIQTIVGGWAGDLEEIDQFQFQFHLHKKPGGQYELRTIGKKTYRKIDLQEQGKGLLYGKVGEQLNIKIDTRQDLPSGFVQIGHHLCSITFDKQEKGKWLARWNLFFKEDFDPTFYLSIDAYDNGGYGASLFLQDPVCHYMFGQDFSYEEAKISFRDIRSEIQFRGTVISKDQIDLRLQFLDESTSVKLRPLDYDAWQIGVAEQKRTKKAEDYKKYNNGFDQLVEDVLTDSLLGTHSILVSQRGQVIFEEYFAGFHSDVPHDTRSLSKSFASAAIGMAIAKDSLKGEHERIKPYFEEDYPEIDWSDDKDRISLHHLMSMSSGLDAIDFGLDRTSYANEGAYQNQSDWTQRILEAPMVYRPGQQANYGSGSPHLVGPILEKVMEEEIEFFMHRNLFGPLGFKNYRIQTDNQGQPYFGGGWYFRPKDLLKFAQLYLQHGEWEGEEIIPAIWVEKSIQKHTYLANTMNKNEYGYLFWHTTYLVNDQPIESIEGRGSGGQYFFIIPGQQIVAVITSGNYRNGRAFQPERIMEAYILPVLLKE